MGNSNWVGLNKFKDFIENDPLYKPIDIGLPQIFEQMIPETLKLYCYKCRDIRTFRDSGTHDQQRVQAEKQKYEEAMRIRRIKAQAPGGAGVASPKLRPAGIYSLQYLCSDCQKQWFICWIEVLVSREAIWKIGQIPPWMSSIPKEIEKELKEDAELFKKALNCISVSHGIGACAYLRRVLENHINPLLELLLIRKEEDGADTETLEKIRKTVEGKDFTSKTKLAYEIAPKSIIIDGMNPLYELHQQFSESLHVHTDADALEIAMKFYKNLEFVILRLKREIQERNDYLNSMKEIQKRKSKKH